MPFVPTLWEWRTHLRLKAIDLVAAPWPLELIEEGFMGASRTLVFVLYLPKSCKIVNKMLQWDTWKALIRQNVPLEVVSKVSGVDILHRSL